MNKNDLKAVIENGYGEYSSDEQKKKEQTSSELVANVTHDLRTPLNGIICHIKNFKTSNLDDNQIKSIEIIEHCADNMMKLINNILDFSKLEAGKYILDEQECRFSKIIDNIVATHIYGIEEKGLRLIVNIANDIPEYVYCDELALGRILNNLVANAVKFTSVGKVMLQIMKTGETNEYVELFFWIVDSGIGISDEEKTRLFKKFSQVDASVTRMYGGTGLGLSITRQLIEMMNGRIFVESTRGEGSIFSFSVIVKKSDKSGNIDEKNFAFSDVCVTDKNCMMKQSDIFNVCRFGTEANIQEINKKMENLIKSIENKAFEKSEMFASNIKELVKGQSKELDKCLFKLILNLRKSNYEESVTLLGEVRSLLSDVIAHSIRKKCE